MTKIRLKLCVMISDYIRIRARLQCDYNMNKDDSEININKQNLFISLMYNMKMCKICASNTLDLFRFMDLEEDLAAFLRCRVDMVTKRTMKANAGKRILSEVVEV